MTATTTTAKKVLDTRSAPGRHWVGDGFPVHGLFGYNGAGVAERRADNTGGTDGAMRVRLSKTPHQFGNSAAADAIAAFRASDI